VRGSKEYTFNPVSRRYTTVQLGFALLVAALSPSAALAVTTAPTIGNNTFASTAVGGSLTQTVTLTLPSAETIKSIAIQPASTEYSIQSITGCTANNSTQSASGTVCDVSVKFTPQLPGSTVSPTLARNATLLFTDSNGNAFAYGLTGAATGPVAKVVPGNISLYAGVQQTGLNALDLGLGLVTGGYGGDGGPATSATFNFTGITASNSLLTQPLARDSAGNIYVADVGNFIIRKIDNTSAHNVTTIAGTPTVTGTSSGSGGLATSATLAFPHALVVDAAGNIFFLDTQSQYSQLGVVYRIDAATKIITAIGGQLYNPSDGYNSGQGGGTCNGNLGQPGYYECGDGGLASYASLPNARNLAIDASGNLYIWENGGYIRKIVPSTGIITTFATAAQFASDVAGTPSFALGGMTLASDGNFYVLVDIGLFEIIYELNTTTQAVTVVAGGQQENPSGNCGAGSTVNGNTSSPYVNVADGQAGYPGPQLFLLTNGVADSTGDLSSDASGNIYYSGSQCTGVDTYDFRPAVFRINLATDTVYLETVGGDSGDATRNYGAYTGFNSGPASAIPDGNGNLYFTTNNQIVVVSASAGSLDFGQQNEFTTGITRIATYENVGNAVDTNPTYSVQYGLNFTDVSSGDANACNLLTQVGVNKTCNIDYSFTPTQPNEVTDTVSLAEAAGSNPGFGLTTNAQTVTLTGDANPEAQFVVTPPNLAFGNVTVGQSSTLTFTVSNANGAAALGLYGIYVFPSGVNSPPTEYALGGTCNPSSNNVSVAAGDTCTVTVTFTPTTVASYPTTLTINNSVTNPEEATFAITGAGTSATTPTGTATLTPNPLVFSTVNVGSYSIETATLTNTGTTTITNIVPSFTGTGAGAFSTYPNGSCTTTLGAGDSCTIVLHFQPPAAGAYTAMLSVADSASGSPQTITLSGIGLPLPAAQVQFTPTELDVIAGTGTMPAGCVSPAEPGPALQTQLCGPSNVTGDAAGNIYIVEQDENVVKKLDPSGNITNFAGMENSGPGSFSGDNGPATQANLSAPDGIALDGLGNVYISDYGNGRIREVNVATGIITTFVGGASGQYFNGGTGTGVVLSPGGITFDPSGNLYIAEPNQQIVVKVTALGVASLFAGVQTPGGPGTAGYNGDNIQANTAELNFPTSVATDRNGNVYIADSLNYRIRYINENFEAGLISTVAGNGTKGDTGDGGVATSAEISPSSIAMNEGDDIFISDGTTIRKVDGQGNITTFAGGGTGGLGGPATSAVLQGVGQPGIDYLGDVLIPVTSEVLSAGPKGILQFGNQAVGTTSAPLTITVENTGNNFLNFTNMTYTPTGDFSVTGGTCEESTDGGWDPGETCTLTVTFTPTTGGALTGSVSVPSNATGSPGTIVLQGTGTATSAPTASLAPGTLGFGSINVGATATAQTLTLSNTGNAVLNISGITIGGANPADFAETTTCGATLAAGANCTISVTFTPASAASFTATVSVADNASESPQTATLTGAGTTPPAPIASLAPSTLTFAGTVVGATTTAQTLTLSNTGNAVLSISGITIAGANPSDFAETTTCGETLEADASCTISVTFTPSSIASFAATVSVADNASGSPQTAALSGAGVAAPDFTVSASPQTQTVSGGSVATYSITVGSLNGDFSNPVTLTATGVPTGATATFTPASVTPGGESASSVMTIQTTSALAMMHRPSRWPWMSAVTMAFCIPLLWWRRRNRQWLLSTGLLLIVLSAGAAMLSGCGGGYYAQPPSQTYTITVVGTSGSTQHSTTVTLTVQ
jgi:trimeric autotransporter adhesin